MVMISLLWNSKKERKENEGFLDISITVIINGYITLSPLPGQILLTLYFRRKAWTRQVGDSYYTENTGNGRHKSNNRIYLLYNPDRKD